jgi:hypothetical protein
MTDKTGKSWMAIGETDDPTALIETFEADAAITKGLPVYLSDDGKVTCAAAAQNCIGVPLKSVADTEKCPVLIKGRIKVTAGGAIARGTAVYGSDADGKVLALADQAVNEAGAATYTVYYNRKLGYALQTASAEDDLIEIQVEKA